MKTVASAWRAVTRPSAWRAASSSARVVVVPNRDDAAAGLARLVDRVCGLSRNGHRPRVHDVFRDVIGADRLERAVADVQRERRATDAGASRGASSNALVKVEPGGRRRDRSTRRAKIVW